MSQAREQAELKSSLAAIVSPANVLADPEVMAGYLSEPRGLYHGRALAVGRPG